MELLKKRAKFQPQLLEVQQEKIDEQLKGLQDAAAGCLEMIQATEEWLGTSLDEPQKLLVCGTKWPYVLLLLKALKGHPEASDKLILELHGQDPKPLQKLFNHHRLIHRDRIDRLKFTNAGVEVTKGAIADITSRNTLYTRSARQNQALDCALSLARAINAARDEGFVSNPEFSARIHHGDDHLTRLFRTLGHLVKDRWDSEGGKYLIVPNYEHIYRIQD